MIPLVSGRAHPPTGTVSSRWRRPATSAGAFLLGGAAATAVAAGFSPLRSGQSSAEAALGLVIAVALVGLSRRRAAMLGAVAMSAAGFTYFDTEPYGRFAIARPPDLVIALLLVVVGLMIGELTVRAGGRRSDERSASGRLRRVQDAASRVARGDDLAGLTDAVAGEVAAVLPGVEECWFTSEDLPEGTVELDRDGRHDLVRASPASTFALPVWALGGVVGHYLGRPVSALTKAAPEQLLTATALADQVGAAFAVQGALPPIRPAPVTSGDPSPAPTLRVVRNR